MVQDVYSPQFVDGQHGWVLGDATHYETAEKLLRTTDGGKTWTPHPLGANPDATEFDPGLNTRFVDANVGWLLRPVTKGGTTVTTVWRTSDGGVTWVRRGTLPETTSEWRIAFASQRVAIALLISAYQLGVNALGTTDEGETWTALDTPVLPNVFGFLSQRFALTPGGVLWGIDGGRVFRTSDMGRSKTYTPLSEGATLETIAFSSDLKGWVIGTDGASKLSQIWRTLDGGLSWQNLGTSLKDVLDARGLSYMKLSAKLTTTGDSLFLPFSTVAPPPPNTAARLSPIVRSADGGETWQLVTKPADYLAFGTIDTYWYATAPTTQAQACINVTISFDAGASWASLPSPEQETKASVGRPCASTPQLSVAPGSRSVMLGYANRWYQTDNRGTSWTQVLGRDIADAAKLKTTIPWIFDQNNWMSLSFTKPEAIEYGLVAAASPNFSAVSTIDGGKTLSVNSTQGLDKLIERFRLTFDVADRGWLLRNTDGISPSLTLDKGKTWRRVDLPQIDSGFCDRVGYHGDVYFTDNNRGWIVQSHPNLVFTTCSSRSMVWTTSDGGQTWSVKGIDAFEAGAIHFFDRNNGLMVGAAGGIARTSDGGATWQIGSTGSKDFLKRLYFVDARLGFALSETGTMIRTADGGTTWQTVSLPSTVNLNDIRFADASAGWLVGDKGTLLATTDGGVSWVVQPSGSPAKLVGVYATDARRVSVLDEFGRLLVTTTGGR